MKPQQKLWLAIAAIFLLTIGLVTIQSVWMERVDKLTLENTSYANEEVSLERSELEQQEASLAASYTTAQDQGEQRAGHVSEGNYLEAQDQSNEQEQERGQQENEQQGQKEGLANKAVTEGKKTSTETIKENANRTGSGNKETVNGTKATPANEQGKSATKEKASQPEPTPSQSTKPKENQQEKNFSKDQQKPTEQEQPTPSKPQPPQAGPTVTYEIVADAGMGTILAPLVVEIEEGQTVLDILIKVTREQKIPMSFRGGTAASGYVEGINNLFEFDRGSGSGWMYRVNGIFPNKGAGVIPLLDGDHIEWLYTIDLGNDIGARLQPFR